MMQIEDIIAANGGFITVRETESSSIYHRLLKKVKDGSVVRVSSGVYALKDSLANTMLDITKIIPGGILCQYSAWAHYELTTQIPMAICVAIKRGRKIKLPEWPSFSLFYKGEDILTLGQTIENVGGYNVPIYDVERCVCDAVKSRNKIGIDVSSEILKNYLNRQDRDLTKLMSYAKTLRVANTISKYLEIQLP